MSEGIRSSSDSLLLRVQAARDKREVELREAFRDRDGLHSLIRKDCERLIAGIGGYAAPIEREARERWIKRRMLDDPVFVARVQAVENMLLEYVQFAQSGGKGR